MKRIASLLPFLLLTLSSVALAQPVVSYITPDIGAAGMNSYVEFIGPSTTTGNFGTDGLYNNALNDAVRVYPITPTDTNFVVVGPLVVSWNGRMISTQVFVKPNAPSGTVVNLVVNRGGQVSNPVPFEIVTPQNLPALSGGGVLGSGGNLGTRSKRGAMIVNSLTLNSGTFSVSTADPDAVTPGNQGYLPFVLISKGPIRIQSGVTLHVNAANQHGGPGGGGGGGRVTDNQASNTTPGGDGYTGGGGGINNPVFSTPGAPLAPGQSTGTTGNSLNLAPGGKSSAPCAENASGGTGHPFGKGGDASCPGTVVAAGGYGGGGGAPQSQIGGGGGYGTQGANGGGTGGATAAGKVHGNDMGVPVAGGSGGASGNPQGIATSAGYGGGGGGAIALYSMANLNNSGSIEAKGASGGTGSPAGGPGSGGYIGLGTKVGAPSVGGPVSVAGGGSSGAGTGRIRGDGFTASGPTSAGGTRYVGITIDTLTYVQSRNFTLRGTYGTIANATVRIYMKSDNSPGWTQLGAPTLSGGIWTLPFTAAAGAGNYYFVAMQSEPSNATGQYDAEPAWVLSQAAANIVKVDLVAKINTDKTVANFADIVCETERVDSVKVWNSGEDILQVTATLARGNQSFTLLSHTTKFTLGADSAVFIKIRYAPATFGSNSDTLVLTNSDPNPGKNPTKVTLNARKLKIRPFFDQAEFDFGNVCLDSTVTRSVWLRYEGDAGVNAEFLSITPIGGGPSNFTLLSPPGRKTLATRDSVELRVQFRPTAAGIYAQDYDVLVGPCSTKVVLKVKATGTKTEAVFLDDPLLIGDVRLNRAQPVTFRVRNGGSIQGTITGAFFKNPDPAFVMTNDLKNTSLAPTQTASGTFTFTPTEVKDYQIELCVVIDGPCPDTTCVTVKGRGVTSLLALSRKEDTLAADKCVEPAPAVTDTVKLYNQGTASAIINSPITSVKGLVTATTTPGLPFDLAPDDSVEIRLSWTPAGVGTFTDTLRITTQSEDPKQRLILLPVTLVRNRVDLSVLKGDGSPLSLTEEIDLKDIFICTAPFRYDLMLRNAGTLNDTLTAALASGTNYSLAPPVLPYVVEAASSKTIGVIFNATAQGLYRDTLKLKSLVCPNDSIIIAFKANFVSLDYDAPTVDFKNRNVGIPSPMGATLTNKSTSPSSVRYTIDSARVEPQTAPFALGVPVIRNVEIAPNEVFTQNVVFTPPAVGDYNAELWVFVGGPCPDTIKIPLVGHGIESNVLVQPGGLNFGTKYLCENDSTLIVTVKNTGKAPFNITDITVDGTDKVVFEVTRKPQPIPFPMAPQQVDTVVVRFTPGMASADGLLRALLTIKTDDGTSPEVTVDLVGERRRQVLSTPSILDFGRVEVGESDTLEIQLDNRTTDPMTISDLMILPPFELIDMPDPVTLAPMGSIKVRVRFTPTDSTSYSEPLVVAQSAPCVDTTRLAVTGEGKITPVGTVEIVIPLDVHGNPGERIAIPIVMQKAIALAETGVTTFEAVVRFNRTLLIPLGVRSKHDPVKKAVAGLSGSILDTSTLGNQKVVKLRITNSPMILEPDTLGFIDALVVLGDAISTPLVIDTLYWTDGLVKGTRRDGLFTLSEYCDQSTPRVIRVTNEFGIKRAVPNPFNPSTEIIFETVERGATTLQIFDSYGRLVETLVDGEDLPVQTHAITWSATGASSGLYYAVLVTPTQRSVHTLMLVK